MSVHRKRYSADEKTKVAIEAIKGQKTLNELAAEYGVHPSQITQWKKQALEEIGTGFSGDGSGVSVQMKRWWHRCIRRLGN